MNIFEFPARVSYSDITDDYSLTLTGAMRMMQEAAIVHSNQTKFSVFNTHETHLSWMLVRWRARMVGQARWNDNLTVRTWPHTMERVTSDRCFEIVDANGAPVAIGESTWILVNSETHRAARVTPEVVEAYPLVDREVFDSPLLQPVMEEGEVTYRCRVQRRDIDTQHHVNNLVYLDYAKQALPEDVYQRPFREIGVKYSRQMLLGDEVRCVYYHADGCHLVDIRSEDDAYSHAQITLLEY